METYTIKCASCDRPFKQTERRKKEAGNYCTSCTGKIESIMKFRTLRSALEIMKSKPETKPEKIKDKEDKLKEVSNRLLTLYGVGEEEIDKSIKFHKIFKEIE